MVYTRKQFKKRLKYSKKNKNRILNEKLINDYCNNDNKSFWSKVKNQKNYKITKSSIIDGQKDFDKIVDCFSELFKGIFDDKVCQGKFGMFDVDNVEYKSNIFISVNEVITAIGKLKPNMGHDKIHTFHLKFAPVILFVLISNFVTSLNIRICRRILLME